MTYWTRLNGVFVVAALLIACNNSAPEPETTPDAVPTEAAAPAEAVEPVAAAEQVGPERERPERADEAGRPAGGPPQGAGGPPLLPVPSSVPDFIEAYKVVAERELDVHVFLPTGHSSLSKRAAFVFMHGGALRRGSPEESYDVGSRFNAEQMVVVLPEYRLLSGDTPATLDQIVADTKSAIRWTRANAERLGVDPNRIVVGGHSAGAYLALSAGVVPGFDEASEDLSVSAAPNAMILWSTAVARNSNGDDGLTSEGVTIESLTPATHLREGLPPAFFIHGDADDNVPHDPALAFQQQYVAAGNQAEFVLVEGADHFFRAPGQRTELFDAIAAFLNDNGF